MKSSLASPDGFFAEIRELIVTARTAAARSVNLIQVYTNFEIGKRIVEQEQRGENRAEYGKQLLKVLSGQLTEEFGKGFSPSTLAYMRSFTLPIKTARQFSNQRLENSIMMKKSNQHRIKPPLPRHCLGNLNHPIYSTSN